MPLISEDLKVLSAPFAPQDHEFNRGYIYISEEAICARIEQVDPSWEWRISELSFVDGMATVIGALSICDVTRYGTGQQLAQIDKDSGSEKVGESRKGATTDAMKRAARLFGIGRYLLQCPKDVKGYGPELNKWIASLKQGAVNAPAPITPQSAPSAPKPAPAASAAHRSQEVGRLEKMYQWAFETHKATREDVNRAIDYTGKTLERLTANETQQAVKDYMQSMQTGAKDFE